VVVVVDDVIDDWSIPIYVPTIYIHIYIYRVNLIHLSFVSSTTSRVLWCLHGMMFHCILVHQL
jgi:hypothetical protein